MIFLKGIFHHSRNIAIADSRHFSHDNENDLVEFIASEIVLNSELTSSVVGKRLSAALTRPTLDLSYSHSSTGFK
jgi:hypothetical protein